MMVEDQDAGVPRRRVFRRTDLTQVVEIEPLDGSGGTVRGELVNLGCGGLLARVERGVVAGTRCRARIPAGEQGVRSYSTRGIVLRTRRTERGDYVALEFHQRMDALRSPVGVELSEHPFQLLPSRVLVVDDEETVRSILGRFLRSRGCDVDMAVDGEEALASLRREQSDMLLLDLRMPKVDGLEVLRSIREEELRAGPICAISGYASDEEAREALRLGASDFINKPLDLKYLDWSLKLHRVGVAGG